MRGMTTAGVFGSGTPEWAAPPVRRPSREEIEEFIAESRRRHEVPQERETARAPRLEITELDKLRATPDHSSREVSSVERAAVMRTAVHDARQVIREARSEGASDAEILAEAATISPRCRALYAALL